jgi:voltage-gated potassium channel
MDSRPSRPGHPAAIDAISSARGGKSWLRWAWREWCFIRAVGVRFRARFALMAGMLVVGAALFLQLDPSLKGDRFKALYYTWALIFNQPQGEIPESGYLKAMYLLVPLVGLWVFVDAIVDFGLLLRDRRRHEHDWCRTMTHSMSNHIVLIGLGKLGYRTFVLLRKLGENVVVVERSGQNQFLEDVRRDGSPLFVGDARREALLEDANIRDAKSIILATNDDLANLEIALDARKLNPNVRVVMRMFDQNMADKIRDGFSIHIAMSHSAMAAPAFATAAIDRANLNSMVVSDQLVVMQRWAVEPNGALAGKTIGDLMNEYGVCIVEHTDSNGAKRLFPAPGATLRAGDEILVQGALQALAKTAIRVNASCVG